MLNKSQRIWWFKRKIGTEEETNIIFSDYFILEINTLKLHNYKSIYNTLIKRFGKIPTKERNFLEINKNLLKERKSEEFSLDLENIFGVEKEKVENTGIEIETVFNLKVRVFTTRTDIYYINSEFIYLINLKIGELEYYKEIEKNYIQILSGEEKIKIGILNISGELKEDIESKILNLAEKL